jgi:hypothetical protein
VFFPVPLTAIRVSVQAGSLSGRHRRRDMKLRTLLTFVAALALFTVSAFAAGIDGKWTATMETPNGSRTTTFNFKADGNKLTGTMTGRQGAEAPIEDGKIDGNNISFTRTMERNGEKMQMKYTGTLSGDELKLKVSTPQGDREMVAKRSAT